MTRKIHGLVAALVTIAGVPSALAAEAAPASVYVVHGIPGRDVAATLNPQLPVDVLVNGSVCLLQGLTFGDIKGPFQIPAGAYTIAISTANTLSPCSNSAVVSTSATVTAGETAAVVAALSPSGAPTAYAFGIDLSTVTGRDNRLLVAHAADAPAVTIRLLAANGTLSRIKDLMPGMEFDAQVPKGQYTVSVLPTGSLEIVLGPLQLGLPVHGSTLVFAVGSAASGSLTLLTKTIPDVF